MDLLQIRDEIDIIDKEISRILDKIKDVKIEVGKNFKNPFRPPLTKENAAHTLDVDGDLFLEKRKTILFRSYLQN